MWFLQTIVNRYGILMIPLSTLYYWKSNVQFYMKFFVIHVQNFIDNLFFCKKGICM